MTIRSRWALYLETMKPYTEELMAWDDAKQIVSFAKQWKSEDVRIITVDGEDVGWLQTDERPDVIFLQQLFIRPSRQRAGVGSEVLQRLIESWEMSGKPTVLMVLKNNPARRLYERAGFLVTGEEGVKYRMKRLPDP